MREEAEGRVFFKISYPIPKSQVNEYVNTERDKFIIGVQIDELIGLLVYIYYDTIF